MNTLLLLAPSEGWDDSIRTRPRRFAFGRCIYPLLLAPAGRMSDAIVGAFPGDIAWLHPAGPRHAATARRRSATTDVGRDAHCRR